MVRCLLAAVVAIVTAALLTPRAVGYPWAVCGGTSFAPNSTFQTNFNRIAASLPSITSASQDLYATAVVGAVLDQVWAMALCLGDVNTTDCLSCLTQAFRDVQSDCPGFKDATIYYDPCMLGYSSAPFLSAADTDSSGDIYVYVSGLNVTSSPVQFNRLVAALANATAEAAFNSTRRFATGEADFVQEVPKVYAVAQCTPNQTSAQCRKCLTRIIARKLGSLENASGGRILWVSCNFRYEITPFFNGPAMVRLASKNSGVQAHAPAGMLAAAGGGGRNHRKVLIIALVAALSVFFAVLAGCVLLFTRLRQGHGKNRQRLARTCKSSETEEALKLWRIEERGTDFTLYDFTELAAATCNFSIPNRLGRGGFGPVYKGRLRDGAEIAVKRLSAQSLQGLVEFKNEIQLIAKLQHTNLVRLVGCCVQEEEKMLVYEYMPNGSLDFFIFDPLRGRLLDWTKRLHIIEGIVQGLLYLHRHSRVRIIHRDLKASNILLDKDLNPKISDFGMARIFDANITKANTKRVVGTYGYMAPEYASEGIFSVRSDVFSFGVLLLEIVSGKRNSSSHQHYGDFINLLGYAWQLWSEGRGEELIDPTLGDFDDMESIMRCIKVALLCVQKNAMDRPTMAEVTTMLDREGPVLRDPMQPPHFHLRITDDDYGGEDGWEAENRPQFTGSFSTNDVTVTMIEEGR